MRPLFRLFVLPAVLLALAAVPALAQPTPPNRFFGTAMLNGAPAPAGTAVTALVNGKSCGAGEVRGDGRYVVDVDDAGQTPGCGAPGATVTFQVGGVAAAQTGVYQRGFFTELNLSAPGQPAAQPFIESALFLDDPRPCIPEPGLTVCDATRAALWNGEANAWAARGVTDPDARFNETVVFRVRAGDPGAIRNIARILGTPYLQITRLRFKGNEFIEVTNLGGGSQDMTGWIIQAVDRSRVVAFPDGFVMAAGDTCRIYSGSVASDSCGNAAFDNTDVWPDDNGRAVLYYAALELPGADTRYSADPANQPPPPNLQGVQ